MRRRHSILWILLLALILPFTPADAQRRGKKAKPETEEIVDVLESDA